MNFFPVGPLARRSGIFFIRRSFKDNPVYKFVLHHYVDYLIDKRFSLEWYIEGGRSRSGKLLPPRFGMLSYVVDAYRRGKSDDVMLIPVSIAYDQIQDVGEYAAEQSGKPKEREGFSWFLRLIRRLGRRYGEIYFRFGEPISLAKTLGPAGSPTEPESDENDLAVQKLAFEVAFRINRVTPITESSLLTLALLGVGDQAVTVAEATRALSNLLAIVERRDLPRVGDLGSLAGDEGIRRALDALVENSVVSRFSEGPEPVYRIGPEQQLSAAYYRNTIVHFFVNDAIAELALLRAAEDGVDDPIAEFWDEAMRLRDLLKFEFFFAEKDVYRAELRREVSLQDGEWEARVRGGRDEIASLVRTFRPFSAHRVLRPFLDAYRLLSDLLEHTDPGSELDQGRFVSDCLGLGRQYLLQHRIRSAASVSQELIRSAWRLADSRDLLGTGGDELVHRRRDFAVEIRDGLRRVEQIEALAVGRRTGLID
jgi:glycerol-3-phosphate O-acyltransferase